MIRQKEDSGSHDSLQGRPWPHQDQWRSNRTRSAGDPPFQSIRTDPPSWPPQVIDMRIRIKGGGHTSHIHAIHQNISKALVAYYQKFVDEEQKKEIKDILVRYDRTLLVANPRRCEPKKFGGRDARARFQKSYR